MPKYRVEQIDHVHVHVSDREVAADWYAAVLGLRKDDRFAGWADDPDGPLMLLTASGDTRVALFGGVANSNPGRTIAFRIEGRGFLEFVAALPSLQLWDGEKGPLAASDVVDHDLAWSLYFRDPDGNRIELTTYDYGPVRSGLGRE